MAFYACTVFKDGELSPRGTHVSPSFPAPRPKSPSITSSNPADGRTALHFSAGRGHLANTRFLVHACGIDVDAKDADGATALHRAVVNNRPDMVECLACVKPVAPAAAESQRQVETEPQAQAQAQAKATEEEEEKGQGAVFANLNAADKYGGAPLHIAADRGYVPVCEKLLSPGEGIPGADPNVTDTLGVTPLHNACIIPHPAVAEVILRHGGDPLRRTTDGVSPLRLASGQDNPALLCNCGIDQIISLMKETGGDGCVSPRVGFGGV